MKRVSLIVLVSLYFIPAFSQGKLEIVADSMLYEVVKIRYERKKAAEAKPDTLQVAGYRVQVFFSNEKKKAEAMRDKVIKLYPEYAKEVYLPYQSPNYKVRVGNFIKEADAKALEKLLSKNFENVFIVRDKVRYIKNKPKEVED
ncbi:MAG: SPOR domain-containing protein [Bacteroidia bacterium]